MDKQSGAPTKPRRYRFGVLTAAALAVTFGLIAVPNVAHAHKYEAPSWGNPNLRIYVATTSGEYRTAVYQAAANYSNQTDVTLTNTTAGGPAFSAAQVNNGADGYEGFTRWKAPIGITIAAHSIANRHYLDAASLGRKKVIFLHELGHGLGLAHETKTTKLVMFTSGKTAYNHGVRSLRTDDINGINNKY